MNPYGSEAKKKIDLRKRLYDSGISYYPMPSVVRPIESQGIKSFSANMNACKFLNFQTPLNLKYSKNWKGKREFKA
jgi:hypothetical protein